MIYRYSLSIRKGRSKLSPGQTSTIPLWNWPAVQRINPHVDQQALQNMTRIKKIKQVGAHSINQFSSSSLPFSSFRCPLLGPRPLFISTLRAGYLGSCFVILLNRQVATRIVEGCSHGFCFFFSLLFACFECAFTTCFLNRPFYIHAGPTAVFAPAVCTCLPAARHSGWYLLRSFILNNW